MQTQQQVWFFDAIMEGFEMRLKQATTWYL